MSIPEKSHLEELIATHTDEYQQMLWMIALYKPDRDIEKWIKEAYDSKEWNWRESDGCTGASEFHSPVGMRFPPCVLHDYLREMYVTPGKMPVGECDALFYRAQVQFGVNIVRAAIRTWVVRWPAWWLWCKWNR